MKFRIAKKIIEGFNPNWIKRFYRLRPPIVREDGEVVFPSHHDIYIVKRAMRVYMKHIKRNKKK